MGIFNEATNSQAFLKAGIMGHAGSGKTYTATEIACGLIGIGRERGLDFGGRPVLFFDTETGSDWVRPRLAKDKIQLKTVKTRAFRVLKAAIGEAEQEGGVLLIDSITHVWRELCAAYTERVGRTRLEFQDWAVIKEEWSEFTDAYVNSAAHIILSGRAGYEYDMVEDDRGRRNLEKTAVKMKAEGETGYEPSLLVFMERYSPGELTKIVRRAHILKDRASMIDGQFCDDPTFEFFRPHVEFLNLGGLHVGVDDQDSRDLFTEDGYSKWVKLREMHSIACDEIKEELVREFPGRADAAIKAKADLIEEIFGTRSWTAVESMKFEILKAGRDQIWQKLRGYGYGEKPESLAAAGASDARVDAMATEASKDPLPLPEGL